MAFTFNVNQGPITGAQAMFSLKEAMKTAGWTVPSSSDGTTYNASGDQITTGASGAGGFANSRAWIRLRSPTVDTVTRELIFQRDTALNTTWRIKYSHSATFSGGSPAATVTPSATDEGNQLGGGTDASPTFAALFAADSGYRYHCMAGGAGESYSFFSFSWPIGGGNVSHAFFFDRLVAGTFPAADADPYVMLSSLATNVLGQSGDFTGTNIENVSWSKWYRKGLSGQTFMTFRGAQMIERFTSPANVDSLTGKLGTNPHNSKDDVLPIIIMHGIGGTYGTTGGYAGIPTYTKYLGLDRVTGDTLTVSTASDRVIVRPISLPWDGSVPIL